MLTMLSILPFVIFLWLLFIQKQTLLKTAGWTLLVTTILVVVGWQIDFGWLITAYGKGFLIALDILIIVFGAIFFLEIMRDLKIIANISGYLETISKDYRVQIILLAWMLENFLEGTAGFGAPSTVVAPLMVGLGLSPLNAVVISLLGNSTSVVFGAAGTPIRIGLAGLDWNGVPALAATINILGLIIPVFMLWFLTLDRPNGRRDFWEAVPFALWAGIAFVIPSWLTVRLGQEFPSILGAVIGMIVLLITIKLGVFMPKKERVYRDETISPISIPLWRAATPYILLVLFLIGGKFALSNWIFPISLGNVVHNFNFYNPGLAFLASGLIVALLWRNNEKIIAQAAAIAGRKSLESFLIIAIMSIIVQLLIFSGHNQLHIQSAIDVIADLFTTNLLPIWASWLGAFGSFMTGSATVSNIMFGKILADAAQAMNLETAKILALCLVGGAAGNMIALADMLTAETVVGIKNQERTLIKYLIIPCVIYVLLAGLIGWLS
ncbi:MAG TPA: L-lactate permease [bacterium]|nr:L-lactate permease [bacterium]